MIVRYWRGRARLEVADDYVRHLQDRTLPELRALPGFRGASIQRRREGDAIEFMIATEWESEAAVAAFAGADVERAVVPPEVRRMMIECDERARHYEVVDPGRAST